MTVLGTSIGFTAAGPCANRFSANCTVTSVAPKAVPRMIPMRSLFSCVICIFASSSARRADATAMGDILSIRRRFFTEMNSRGEKLVKKAIEAGMGAREAFDQFVIM